MRVYENVTAWSRLNGEHYHFNTEIHFSSDIWQDRLEQWSRWYESLDEDRKRYANSFDEFLLDFDRGLLETVLDEERLRYLNLYIEAYGYKKRMVVLSAHGIVENYRWFYRDGQRKLSLQKWVDRHDGQYAMLVLSSCNIEQHTPKARKSLLMVPDCSFSLKSVRDGNASFSLIHPREGDMEYVIEYETAQLEAALAQ